MKASILKSTESKNGGFVNTLSVQGIKKDPILGDMTVNDRYYFKTPNEREMEEFENFSLANYSINPIKSTITDAETGEEKTIVSKWLTPLA